jgi:predicted ribosome quality control (RQC) complex YloA/Tae2 family protein
VGKNNRQNEELTLRKAQKNHFWLHCRHYPGSHVILCTDNPDRASLEYAASLAAWYSKARSSPKVEVVWTRVKNVKKIPGAKPGMVQYTDYRSTLIEPRPGGAGGESP